MAPTRRSYTVVAGGANGRAAEPSTEVTETVITLTRLEHQIAEIPIVGTAPLIVHAWSRKAREMMLSKQMGKIVTKTAKDPEQDFEDSLYRLEGGGFGFPASGFKAAIIGAARLFPKSGLTMTALKSQVLVLGEGSEQLVPLDAPEPRMREDMVRLESGVADIRFRGEFWPWKATIRVKFLPNRVTFESLIALVDAAGLGGIGEWRPSAPKSASGSFGTWQVAG